MPHVIESIKDGIDRQIEENRAIEGILDRKPQTVAVVAVREDLKVARDALQRARARVGVAGL